MAPEESKLVATACAGDADALSELLRRHGPSIEQRLVIQEVWRPVLEAADVMQVTYLEAFLHIRTFDPARGTPFRAWLQRIADNNLRDAIRGLQRLKQPQPRDRIKPTSREESIASLFDALGGLSATPSRNLGKREALGLLDQAVAKLPPRYAEVVRLYDLEGLAIEDVANKMNRSPGAVHMLRARAHDQLREAMGSSPGYL